MISEGCVSFGLDKKCAVVLWVTFYILLNKILLGKNGKISTGKRKKLDERRPSGILLGFNLPIPLDIKTAKIQ